MVLENFGITVGSQLFYQIIYTLGIIIGSIIITRITNKAVMRFAKKAHLEAYTAKPISKLVSVIIYIVAILSLLGVWGLQGTLTGLLASAGVIGIVVGFATKDILSDLLAGLMLFFDRPFKIEDAIVIGEIRGIVKDIGIRSTKIKTFDGKFVTMPNGKIASSIITNLSVYEKEGRRLDLSVGVDYNTDLSKAKKTLDKAIKKMQKKDAIKEDPAPRIFLDNFGDSSINFKVYFWFNPEYVKENDMWFYEIKGELIGVVKKEFDKADITIPYPQITLSERRKKKVNP